MQQRKFIRARWNARRPRYLANPLWPLEELRDLRDPLFAADPEFTPFDIEALRRDSQTSDVFLVHAGQLLSPVKSPLYQFEREFPIPKLVTGLPWRYAQHITPPVVPEGEFLPLDLSFITH